MSNLTRFQEDSWEIYVEHSTGESFTSVSGYARMSGKSKSTISERLNRTVRENEVKHIEIPTTQGLRTVRLINEDLEAVDNEKPPRT